MKKLFFLLIVFFTINANCQVQLKCRAYLNGCYNATTLMMTDSLRWLNYLPIKSPYDTNVKTFKAIFSDSGSNAIVDWVQLKIKSTTATYTQSCLIQRDGDVVDINGSTLITFICPQTTYTVQIKHRNHLGVQTASAISLNCAPTMVDFTLTSTAVYLRPSPNNNPSPLTGARKTVGSVQTLYAGDCSQNGVISANTGTGTDRTVLSNYTGISGLIYGYSVYDCNMNGYANFNGPNPDRLTILANCNNSTTTVVNQQTSF